jgi:predicted transcriptional regulator
MSHNQYTAEGTIYSWRKFQTMRSLLLIRRSGRRLCSVGKWHSGSPKHYERSCEIVVAYVSNHSVAVSELTKLLSDVHAALKGVANGPPAAPEERKLVPAVPIKRSVTHDFIICLEDGKKFKSLKRHLRTQYNLSPEDYRDKWALPADYPMVAPSYAERRSALAKTIGLGRGRKRGSVAKANKK